MTNEDGYWRGGIYTFTIDVPDSYPHQAPKVHLLTPIYHPNIDTEGNVCLNILRKDWSPVFSIQTIVFGVLSLFFSPEPTDPLNHQAAAM
jgi:ubiquitin-conjugating enzyme E2 M